MTRFIFILCLLCLATGSKARETNEINAVLRDRSFLEKFGRTPDASDNEQARIRVHLSYVERLLRTASVVHLTAQQLQNRMHILDILHEYWQAGIFPINEAFPGERRPCFIDAYGNICAVGYLIEQTKSREIAEDINKKHQYDFILDMNEDVVEQWACENGLTLLECAMIQPAYGGPVTDNSTNIGEIRHVYGISSAVVGGAMIGLNIANLSKAGGSSKKLSRIGIAGGAVQVIMGIASVRKPGYGHTIEGNYVPTSFKAQNNLSYANIALGSASIVTNVINLAMHKRNKSRKNVCTLYSHRNYANSLSLGFSLTRRI